MADTKNTTEPTDEQVAAAARVLARSGVVQEVSGIAYEALRAALSVSPSAPTEDDREALTDEALWDWAGDLFDWLNIEDLNPPGLIEGVRDRFVARFNVARRSPVAPSEDVAKLIDLLVEAVHQAEGEATVASETGYASYDGGSIYEGVLRRNLLAALRSGAAVPVEPGEEFVIEAEASLDEDGLSHLPRRIGPFASREAAEVWLDARRPLWGSYEIAPLFRPTREEK